MQLLSERNWHANTYPKKGPCRSSNPLLCTKIHNEIIKQIVPDLFLVKYKHYEKHHKGSFPDAFSQKTENENTDL